MGENATFVYDRGFIGVGLNVRDCRDVLFRGIDIDQSAPECSVHTAWNLQGRSVIEDVEFTGYSDPKDSGKKLGFNVRERNGALTLKNVIATDGTEVGRRGVDHNAIHKQQYDRAYWSGLPHGTAYLVDCEAAHWSEIGLYASRTSGGIVADGGNSGNQIEAMSTWAAEALARKFDDPAESGTDTSSSTSGDDDRQQRAKARLMGLTRKPRLSL